MYPRPYRRSSWTRSPPGRWTSTRTPLNARECYILKVTQTSAMILHISHVAHWSCCSQRSLIFPNSPPWPCRSQAGRTGFQGRVGLAKRTLGRYTTVHDNREDIVVRCFLSDFSQIANIYRYYTWSSDSVDTTLEYVPMLWGERQTEQWVDTIDKTIITQKVTHALGFNE